MNEKPFVLPIKTPLGYYFYEIARNEIVCVDKDLFDYITSVLSGQGDSETGWSEKNKAAYNNLLESGYLQPNPLKKVRHPATDYIECYLTRGLQQITLQVTQNCNLRCNYCIYSEFANKKQRSHSSVSMSFEMAKQAIDFYRIHSIDVDDKIIAFYGGEPFLAFPLIKRVVEYAEEVFYGKRIKFTVTTNATLLTDEIVAFLLKHEFTIFFSLDGPEQMQNMNRVFQDGRGTYDVVISKIKSVYDKDPDRLMHHSISMVVTPQHDYDELLKLFEIPELESINLLYSYVERDASTIYPNEKFTEKYQYDRFIAYMKRAKGDSSGLNKIIEGDTRKLDAERQKMVSHEPQEIAAPGGPCIPGKTRLFVNCFGELYPCERVNEGSCMRIGTLETGFDFKNASRILNVAQVNPEQCRGCFAFSLCSVCGKFADDGTSFSTSVRDKACSTSKSIAYNRILNRILDYESAQHIKEKTRTRRGEDETETYHLPIYKT